MSIAKEIASMLHLKFYSSFELEFADKLVLKLRILIKGENVTY